MKIITILLYVGTLSLWATNAHSQNAIVHIPDYKDLTIETFIREVEAQTNYLFVYSKSEINTDERVSLSGQNLSVKSALEQIAASAKIAYRFNNEYIVLTKTELEVETIKQGIRVTGKVFDDTGDLLPGVSVLVIGTTTGATTDVNGEFSITVPDETAVLQFTFVGFRTQEIMVGKQRIIAVTMQEETAQIGEVVVVAFGQQKKESVVGSVTTVNIKDLKTPTSNLTTALAGNMAGVIAYQRSGEPGQDNADFFVRGITTFGTNTNPLILIDGVELSSTDLAKLRPDDIASFSILKDATATALYGARGANGVVLVTTKQGTVGPAKISFRFENSVSMPTRNIELADPITYMKLHNEAILTRDPSMPTAYTQEKIEMTEAGFNPLIYPANDWRKMLFKDYTMNQRANLSVSGGGGVARYYISGSYNRDNGIMKVDGRNNFNNNIAIDNYNLRINVNLDITKTTEISARLSGNFEDYQGPIPGGTDLYNRVIRSNPVLFPAYFPIDEDHKHVQHIMFGNYYGAMTNPYALMVQGYKDRSRSQILAQVELKQDMKFLTEGLSIRGMLNISRLAQFGVDRFYNPFYYQVSQFNRQTWAYRLMQTNIGTEYLSYRELSGDRVMNSTFYFEGMANYAREFGKNTVSGLLVFITRQSMNANAGTLQLSLPSRNLGLSGRVTYAYDSRYFSEFNFGYNGSERFDENHRFGFFPSAGVAWGISNEHFWEPIKHIVSNLRVRYSYGWIGNDQIGSANDRFFYLSEVDMNSSARSALFGQNYDVRHNGILVGRYANPNITWEKAAKQNFALELGLFGQMTLIAEYFTEYRSNILMNRADIPRSMGLTATVRANVGEASGRGVDLSYEYQKIWTTDFWTSARANFTYATSKYEVFEEPQYDEYWRSRIGRSLKQGYGYIAERLFVDDHEARNSPPQYVGIDQYGGGDIKYLDVSRDGRIDEVDIMPIGNPTVPEIIYGFGFSVGYKGFDFSAFLQGAANQSFWLNAASTSPFYSDAQMLKVYADSYWSEETQNIYATWPRLSPTINSNNAPGWHRDGNGNLQVGTLSTWFMRDATFLRLKQAELGYTLPRHLTEKLRMSSLRFYVSGSNLLLFSRFKLWDVEMAGEGLGYPIQRVFNLGVNLSFN